MPVYEYLCECGKKFEHLQTSFTPYESCSRISSCEKDRRLSKLVSSFAVSGDGETDQLLEKYGKKLKDYNQSHHHSHDHSHSHDHDHSHATATATEDSSSGGVCGCHGKKICPGNSIAKKYGLEE
ncbi:MAG: hypothetical protein AAF518_02225 [Spirochaetota bacterium]